MALSDFFNNATVSTRPDAGALTAQKLIAASSITVDTTAGWPVSPDSVHFIIYQVDAGGNKVAGTQTDWKGTVTSSTAIGSLTLKAGTDQIYPVGSKVIATPTGAWADDMVTGLLVAHEQDGTLKAGAVDVTAVIADGVVTRAKLATAVTTELNDGWTIPTQTVSSVTNNGNKSYDVVFNSTVAALLSPGMRLRTTRTVAIPVGSFYCDGTNDYFSKTSPNKLTFTDNFTCSGWINLLAYQQGGIISRFNGTSGFTFRVESTGQLSLVGFNGAAGNYRWGQTYQSIPLSKWTHVAATWSGSTVLLYIDGILVPSATTTAGTAPTTIAQAGDLQIGATNGAGFFNGRIAQPAVFDAVLTASTIRSYISQSLSGSETNLKSAYSGAALTDLNTTTPNDLTANGGALNGLGYSPFCSNYETATLDYALVMKVSTTTATVQVPEGCTIPTSGGVSAVAYSTTANPYGWVADKGRWEVGTLLRINTTQASPVTNTWYNMTSTTGVSGGTYLTVPVGNWQLTYTAYLTGDRAAASAVNFQNTLSTSSSTESDMDYTMEVSGNNVLASGGQTSEEKRVSVTTATPYYLNTRSITAGPTNVYLIGSRSSTRIYAIPAGV